MEKVTNQTKPVLVKPVLVSTLHDPAGESLNLLASSNFYVYYSDVVVNVTKETDEKVKKRVESIGRIVESNNTSVESSAKMAMAYAFNAVSDSHYHYCELMSLLMWSKSHHDELVSVTQSIKNGFTVYGRTPRAIDKLPFFQRYGERAINSLYGLLYGKKYDFSGTSRAFDRYSMDVILSRQKFCDLSIDIEWPLMFERVNYLEVDGLSTVSAPSALERFRMGVKLL